jgi:hypothetical protein
MGLFSEMMEEVSEQSGRIADLEAEVSRLRIGLSTIHQGALTYGAAWCKAQARGTIFNLDFDAYPKTGRSETE